MKSHPAFSNLYVSAHPLIQHKLSHMRRTECDKARFKSLLKEITWVLGYEATAGLALQKISLQTPVASMEAPVLKNDPPVIVPVLRAGLGMSEGLEELMPDSRVGHIGLYRDEETKRPVEYLAKLPIPDSREQSYIIVDPMLATGYSAKYALDLLVGRGVNPARIVFMALVAAPEGVRVLRESWPQVRIYAASLDEHLNNKAYIVPGLGDAGDRLFGTDA